MFKFESKKKKLRHEETTIEFLFLSIVSFSETVDDSFIRSREYFVKSYRISWLVLSDTVQKLSTHCYTYNK